MQSYIHDYMELPKPIHLPEDTEVTKELIEKLLEIHEKDIPRYRNLEECYKNKALILTRRKREEKSNNKLALPYPAYITDMMIGLTVGKPVNYTMAADDGAVMEELQNIFDYNDEQDENTQIAKIASIKGRSYEIVYVDEEGKIRFNEVQPENVIYVYDDKICSEPLMALYVRDINNAENLDKEKKDRAITVYGRDVVYEYAEVNGELQYQDEYINVFGMVNIIELMNNDEGSCDFEGVLTLIDAMNLLQSDTANEFEENTDAFLVLKGMPATDTEDIKQLKEDKILLLDGTDGNGQGAEWLTKIINDTALENFKTRLDADIHKFAKVPNMSDENFAGNVSGESMKYKLFATDQVIAQKHRKLKTALLKRIELIFAVMNIQSAGDFDYRRVTISFADNKPFNELDNANMVKTLLEIPTSKQFALSKLRGIDDVQEELKRQEQEQDAYAEILMKGINIDELSENGKDLSSTSKEQGEAAGKELQSNN